MLLACENILFLSKFKVLKSKLRISAIILGNLCDLQIYFGSKSRTGSVFSNQLLWNWVKICHLGWHTPVKNSTSGPGCKQILFDSFETFDEKAIGFQENIDKPSRIYNQNDPQDFSGAGNFSVVNFNLSSPPSVYILNESSIYLTLCAKYCWPIDVD